MNNRKFLEYAIYYGGSDHLNNMIDGKHQFMINTINPHSYCVALTDKLFHEALLDSDALLPDGSGISLAIAILYKDKVHKYSGPQMHLDLLNIANHESKKVFYLGSSQKTLDLIKERISIEYPNIIFESFSPPYKDEFSDEDNKLMIDTINSFAPDFLFVGMTAPKQEKWTYIHKKNIDANIICSIGAAFDFFARTVKLPPQWIIDIHLQWFHRLCKEPRRMWKRNFISTPHFLWDILQFKFGLKHSK